MFTTRSSGQPFVGKLNGNTIAAQSYVAEVAWFVRGHTLHRRVLLVLPGTVTSGNRQRLLCDNNDDLGACELAWRRQMVTRIRWPI